MSDGQSLIEHLTELRFRLVRAVWGIAIGVAIAYFFSGDIMNFLRHPIQQYLPSGGLVFTAPMDKFLAHIKISFFAGLLATTPWWLFQVWKFVAPALYQKEKRTAFMFLGSGTLLFLLGAAFCYFITLPAAFHFLMNYGGDLDKPMITISQYINFVTMTSALFGLCFELPLIVVMLGVLGVIDSAFLKKKRRLVVMGLGVLSAIVTPPDLISMLMLLIPLVALFEISLWTVRYLEKRTPRSEALT